MKLNIGARRLIDVTAFDARNMIKDGNADFQYWFDKSISERLNGAVVMNAAAFRDSNFAHGKVDRTIYASKKHS
ncbi:MAG: hypothetical protein EAY75_04500 [Bacteroidetes bacterium]|nr:MAG: hypothetical protein EAY75_04500 [Bacteroidota bacterium]